MTIENTYDLGTVSVDSSGNVTGSSVIWSLVYQFDMISIAGGALRTIAEVVDSSHLTIQPWSGTVSGQAYVIYYCSPLRNANGELALMASKLVNDITGDGYFFYVASGADPDPSQGRDGQYARDPLSGRQWVKSGGVWVLNAQGAQVNLGLYESCI